MHRLKSIKLYFFSILKLSFLSFRNYYFSTNFYNKKLATSVPDRIFYNPSTHLSASLITASSDFYKITNTEIDKDDFQFIISKDKTFKHNLPIAYASSNNGVILIRLTMKYFNEYDALDNFRRSTTKQYLKTL